MQTDKNIHFLGIGGIGVSAIALYFNNKGFNITGSDAVLSEITDNLIKQGIKVYSEDEIEPLKKCFVIIKSSAVKENHPSIVYAKENGIKVIRRAEVLADIAKQGFQIAISGTHGKTTTTAMTTFILKEAGVNPTAFVGGIIPQFNTNMIFGDDHYFVIEADEYDRSFLTLQPMIVGIGNIEADHLDIYEDLNDLKNTFLELINKTPFFGSILINGDDQNIRSITENLDYSIRKYGFSEENDIYAKNVCFENFGSKFDLIVNKQNLGQIKLNVPGKFNILNSLLAISIALDLKIDIKNLINGLKKFTGVSRRFEKIGEKKNILFYDDYAHHPTELEATLSSLKKISDRRLIAVFQPHLYSRTKDFFKEISEKLTIADKVLLLPVYPAREKPIEGVTSDLIANELKKLNADFVQIKHNNDFSEIVKNNIKENDIVITLGAGTVSNFGRSFFEDFK